MTKVYQMNSYIDKMNSPDQDFRYMALNDLMNDIKQDPTSFTGDESVENKVLDKVLTLVEDPISEVKNQAVKALGHLIKVLRENQMELVMDKLIDLSGKNDEEIRDIAGLALKTVTAELPHDSKLAPKTCSKLTPKLLVQLQESKTAPSSMIDILAILSTLVTRFPAYLSDPTLQPQPISVLVPLLQHPRPAVQKRATVTLAQFLPPAPVETFNQLLNGTLIPNLRATSISVQRADVQLIAAIARYTPQRLATGVREIVPGVLSLAAKEDSELREGALQALETLVYRCPTEITPFITSITSTAIQLIKYDPNYTENDDEDEEMEDADDASGSELGDYSDDEDTSYKIRRSATKLLAAIIGTRGDLLPTLLKDVSPVLISRFGDREVSVKSEIWATYTMLLNQIVVYGGARPEQSGLKRKRDNEGGMDEEGSPFALLRTQVPALSKQLFGQLKGSKVPPNILQAGFGLLSALLKVLPGSLSGQTSQLFSLCSGILSQSVSTATASLNISVLQFLALFFEAHSSTVFSGSIGTITPALISSLKQRHPRVAAETFRVFTALISSLRPVKSEDWLSQVYQEALARMKANDTDAEVRQTAEQVIGELWISAPDFVKTQGGAEWDYVLRSSERIESPISVITRVAKEGEISNPWIEKSIGWIIGVLKRSGRSGKADAFAALEVLLQSYKGPLPDDFPNTILPLLTQYLGTADISLLSHSFTVLSILLELVPAKSGQFVELHLMREIYRLSLSPLITGAALDSLLNFYIKLVKSNRGIVAKIVPSLVLEVEKSTKGTIAPGTAAKCIVKSVETDGQAVIDSLNEFTRMLKSKDTKELTLVLSLLTLGEFGKLISLADQTFIFDLAVGHFNSDSEEIKSAAAYAAGSISIGGMETFLPSIIRMIASDASRRLLALHALKEVVSSSSAPQLEQYADALWNPLFENSENAEEASRNVAAACLGKLTTTKPARYLPLLQSRLRDQSPAVRATVLSALRYTLVENTRSYDELLAPVIVEFLSLIVDTDLTVQRLALSALNSAARNKPALIRDHLGSLLPQVYDETLMKPELVEVVQMGPWQHKVDKGLESRKAAYETMYTLLDTCLSRIDLHAFLERVLKGLSDESDEIKVICHMMLFRMSQIAPAATSQRLDDAAESLAVTMKGVIVNKDTVKQDLERASELQRSALRAIAALSKITTPGQAIKFDGVVEQVQRGQYGNEFRDLTA